MNNLPVEWEKFQRISGSFRLVSSYSWKLFALCLSQYLPHQNLPSRAFLNRSVFVLSGANVRAPEGGEVYDGSDQNCRPNNVICMRLITFLVGGLVLRPTWNHKQQGNEIFVDERKKTVRGRRTLHEPLTFPRPSFQEEKEIKCAWSLLKLSTSSTSITLPVSCRRRG